MKNDELPPALERASLSDLIDLQDGYTSSIATFKDRLGAVKGELARRFAESAQRTLEQQGKQHGSGSLQLQDGFVAKFKIDQEVKWDSDKLMAVAQTLPWERVQMLFKIAFSMPEAIYKGVGGLNPKLAEKIDDARTTKIKPAAIMLAKEDAAL